MTPIDWALLPLKKYADFSGRAPRAEYWWYILGVGITGFLLGFVDTWLLRGPIYGNLGPLGLIFTLTLLVPGLAVLVRRLHDTERSGWWSLVKIPSYGLILGGGLPVQAFGTLKALFPTWALVSLAIGWLGVGIFVFLFVVSEGDTAPNRYGSDPYGDNALEEVFA